jgi:hypothetical protein
MLSAPTFFTRKTAQVTIGQVECEQLLFDVVCFLQGTLSEYSVTTRSGDAAEAPLASITSHVDGEMVNASTLTVTGVSTDPDGVAEVRVNDIPATSDDNFLSWEAQVPLQTGINELVVSTADVFLNRNPRAFSIDVENTRIVFNAAEAVFMHTASNRLFVADSELNALVAIDTQTDDWVTLSDAESANGLAVADAKRLIVDSAETRAGLAAPIDEMADLALDEGNQQLLLLLKEPGQTTSSTLVSGRVVSFDLDTGATQLISDNMIPTEEPQFWGTTGILFDTAGQQLLVFQAHNILTIQPVTGDRQLRAILSHLALTVSTQLTFRPALRVLWCVPSDRFLTRLMLPTTG